MSDYDLRDEPWCPVRDTAGQPRTTGLVGLFSQADRISGIEAPMPPGYAALWHVLTALTYRITGLDVQQGTPAQWRRRRDAWLTHGRFTSIPPALRAERSDGDTDGDPVAAYFDRHADRFTLFGHRPFLQDRRLAQQCPNSSGVNKLVLGRPVGDNGATWWTRHHEGQQQALPARQAVWWLLVQWYYGAAGKITARKVNGKQTSDATSGMLRTTITYYPRGATLFDSLMLSLVPPAAARPEDPAAGPDLCPWEWDDLPDPDGPPRTPGGMCSLLTAVHRHAFLLVPTPAGEVGDVYRTWAYRAKTMPPPPAENPFIAYRTDDKEPKPRRARPGRALWRDLDALLPETAPAGYRVPAFLHDFAEIGSRRGITAVAFSQESMTTDHEWWMSTSSPVLMRMFDPDDPTHRAAVAGTALRILRRAEDTAAKTLRPRLRRAWREGTRGRPDKKSVGLWPARAEPLFWESAERLFEQRLVAEVHAAEAGDGRAAAEQETDRRLRVLARDVYDQVTAVAAQGASADDDPYLRFAVIKHRP